MPVEPIRNFPVVVEDVPDGQDRVLIAEVDNAQIH
jgi:hypothetical protein